MDNIDFNYIIATVIMLVVNFVIFISIFKSINRKLKNKYKIKVYSFRIKPLSEYNFFWIFCTVRTYFDFRMLKMASEFAPSDRNVQNIFRYFSNGDTFYEIIFISWLVIGGLCFVDIVLSIIMPNGIYDNGIIEIRGRFIPWSDIKSIDYRNTLMGYSKEVRIYTSDKKFKVVYAKSRDIEKVLKIICKNINVDIFEVTTSFDTVN